MNITLVPGLASTQYTNFAFTSLPETLISGTTQTSDAATQYPSTGSQSASYNNLNQLTTLSGQVLTFDKDGNLLADGSRNYAWDAENRLVKITYVGQSKKQTAFAGACPRAARRADPRDGLGRRTEITGTPQSGKAVATSYLWCGSRICQARNASDAVIREYFAEGEYVPGSKPRARCGGGWVPAAAGTTGQAISAAPPPSSSGGPPCAASARPWRSRRDRP